MSTQNQKREIYSISERSIQLALPHEPSAESKRYIIRTRKHRSIEASKYRSVNSAGGAILVLIVSCCTQYFQKIVLFNMQCFSHGRAIDPTPCSPQPPADRGSQQKIRKYLLPNSPWGRHARTSDHLALHVSITTSTLNTNLWYVVRKHENIKLSNHQADITVNPQSVQPINLNQPTIPRPNQVTRSTNQPQSTICLKQPTELNQSIKTNQLTNSNKSTKSTK